MLPEYLRNIEQEIAAMSSDEIYAAMEKTVCDGGLEYDLLYAWDYTYTWDKYIGYCMKWFRDMWE